MEFDIIEEGKFKSARVEAKKINTRLNEIRLKYDDDYTPSVRILFEDETQSKTNKSNN